MILRPSTPEDYPIVAGWFESRALPIPDRTLLPTSSLVVCIGSALAGHVSLYLDSSVGVGHIDWLATMPGMSMGQSAKVVKKLLEGCDALGKKLFPEQFLMIGCVRNEAMASWSKKAGFIPTEQVHMILKHSHHDRHTTCSVSGDHSSGSRDAILSPEEIS